MLCVFPLGQKLYIRGPIHSEKLKEDFKSFISLGIPQKYQTVRLHHINITFCLLKYNRIPAHQPVSLLLCLLFYTIVPIIKGTSRGPEALQSHLNDTYCTNVLC